MDLFGVKKTVRRKLRKASGKPVKVKRSTTPKAKAKKTNEVYHRQYRVGR